MKLRITVSIMLMFLITSISFGQKTNNNIIVFDITGSMIGLPEGSGNSNIWESSVDLLEKQIKSFPSNEKITLYFFGEKLIRIGDYLTDTPNTALKITHEVQKIKTNNSFENYTCIYKSINDIIGAINKEERNTIYLFTDGNNSNNHGPCGKIKSLNEVASKWQGDTAINEYLYIFKLKDFDLDILDPTNTRTQIIQDALTNLNAVIEPINTNIRITKKNRSSSQQFRITGTGVEHLPQGLKIKVDGINLNNSSLNETAYSIPGSLNANSSVQPFEINTHNSIEYIESGIYKGKVNYSFEDNSKMNQFKIGDKTISLVIKDISADLVFNNLEQSKVTIEFIDKK